MSFFFFFVKETFSVKTFNLCLPRQSHMLGVFFFFLGSYFPLLLLPTIHSKCTSLTETQRLISGFCWQVGKWYVTFIMWYFPFDQLTTQFFGILQSLLLSLLTSHPILLGFLLLIVKFSICHLSYPGVGYVKVWNRIWGWGR